MRNDLIKPVLAFVLLVPGTASAQAPPQPRLANGKPDFTGVWTRARNPAPRRVAGGFGAGNPDTFGFAPETSPMTSWAEERYKLARMGVPDPFQLKAEEPDPALYPYCMPSGFPRAYTDPFPFRIVQTPDILVQIFEYGRLVRQVDTDGRKHSEGAAPTFMGDSIGHWDGDILVIETIDLQEFTFVDNLGHPHSDALRVVERMRRPEREALEIEFMFEDPKAYTKPWTGRKVFRLLPSSTPIMETLTCEDYWLENYRRDLKSGKMQGRP